jgi:hypothetical protein
MAPPSEAEKTESSEVPPPRPPIGRGRRIGVAVLIWVTTILAVVAIFAIWTNRQIFNADNWANTSTRLLQNDKIRTATANYLVDQLYRNVDVAAQLQTRLPAQLKPLSGPIAGALQNAAVAAADRALASGRIQLVWKRANHAADEQFIAIVNGHKGAVSTKNGVVTLDLAPIVTNITDRLGLPNIGAKLPPSVAHVTILEAGEIDLIQNGGKAVRHLALLLTIIVPLLYALAIALAPGRRRRTLMTVGIAIVVAGVAVLAGRSLVESQTVNALVKNPANVPAAKAVMAIATSMLSEIALAFVIVGIPLIIAAWFAGPARLATRGRRLLAPFLRDSPGMAFLLVGAIMVLIFIWRPIAAMGKPAGIIIFFALAMLGTEILRRQTAREFPAERDPGADPEPAPA